MNDFTAVCAGEVRITARGPVRAAAERMFGRLWIDRVPVRLAAEDPGLWPGGPHTCWPARPGPARALLPRLAELAVHARAEGLTDVLLIGAGPQARAADLIARAGPADGTAALANGPRGRLTVLDGKDPGPLLRVTLDDRRLLRTIVVLTAHQPGPDALRQVFTRMLASKGLSQAEIARRFVVVADAGSALAALGRDAGHLVFEAPGADPAGQVFGALSAPALVPAALAGVDVAALLGQGESVLPSLTGPENNPGLVLGAMLAGCVRAGRDKLVLGDFPARWPGLSAWVSPLLTGATEGGLLPVVQDGGLPLTPADDLFQITLDGRPHQDDATVSGPVGAQLVLWEYAAAVAAYLLGADPFTARRSRPVRHGMAPAPGHAAPPGTDGQVAVTGPLFTAGAGAESVEVYADEEKFPHVKDLNGVLDALIDTVPPDGYLAVMAYMDSDRVHGQGNGVRRLAALLAARCSRPVTINWRPLYPVSANDVMENGVFLILTGDVLHDADVPDKRYRLSGLQLAEALGGVRALTDRGHPVVRLHLHNRWAGITHLLEAARGGA
jgi:glucose-6-phosphate isomerase